MKEPTTTVAPQPPLPNLSINDSFVPPPPPLPTNLFTHMPPAPPPMNEHAHHHSKHVAPPPLPNTQWYTNLASLLKGKKLKSATNFTPAENAPPPPPVPSNSHLNSLRIPETTTAVPLNSSDSFQSKPKPLMRRKTEEGPLQSQSELQKALEGSSQFDTLSSVDIFKVNWSKALAFVLLVSFFFFAKFNYAEKNV